MNRDDLIAQVAEKMGVSIEDAAKILDRLLFEISKALDAYAKKLGDEWQANRLEERQEMRQLCHA